MWGNPELLPGIGFEVSILLSVWILEGLNRQKGRRSNRQQGSRQIGQKQSCRPFRQAEFEILFGQGIDRFVH